MSDGNIYFGLAWSPVPICSQQVTSIDFYVGSWEHEGPIQSIDLGGAYTCQDDIKFMNIAFLQDYSKYSPLFEKVKKTSLEKLFFLIYANFKHQFHKLIS